MAPYVPKIPKYPRYPKNIKCSHGTNPMIIILLFIIVGFVIYIAYQFFTINKERPPSRNRPDIYSDNFLLPRPDPSVAVMNPSYFPATVGGISTRLDVLNDPYIPPVKLDGYIWEKTSGDVRGLPPIIAPIQTQALTRDFSSQRAMLPVNVETRGVRSDYNQVGILTKTDGNSGFSKIKMFSDSDPDDEFNNNTLIIPLMGRRCISGRDKWQYYTISNTGTLNSKLPVTVRGRSCSSEYGCDEIMDGDIIFVKGYNHGFKVTMYENTTFSYIPVL